MSATQDTDSSRTPGRAPRRPSRVLLATLLCGGALVGAAGLSSCGRSGRGSGGRSEATTAGATSGATSPGRATTKAESIPRELRAEARPIGEGARFHPALENEPVPDCERAFGERIEAHVELFAKNRVVLLPAGIGTRPPRKLEDGRVAQARCYGAVVTLEPTGIVFARAGARATIASLFAAWGQPLSATRIASFAAPPGTRISAYIDGKRWDGRPGAIRLAPHAEIVLEVGPHVPPHRSFTFPPAPRPQ